MYKDYQDQYGLIHSQIHPALDQSENTPLFAAASFLLMRINKSSMVGMLSPKFIYFKHRGQFHTYYPNGTDNRFSHDNMTGMYIARELGYLPKSFKLPISRWNSHTREGAFERKYWLHPRDIIFYSSLSQSALYSSLGTITLPLLLVISLGTWWSEGTSGKCLWFYRFNTLKLSKNPFKKLIGNVGIKLGELCMRKEHGKNAFIDVFKNYFKDPNHPINQEIIKYYNN